MSEHQHAHGKDKSSRRQSFFMAALMLAGVGMVAALLSPFLLEMMGPRVRRDAPEYSTDAANLTQEELTESRPLASRHAWHSWRPVYDNFGGVKLGSTRQEVGKKYPLHLRGKPDAVPLVYECTNQNSIIKFSGSFYDNRLKEFTLVIGPYRDSAENLKDQLYQGLGEGPRYRISDAESATRIGMDDPDLTKLLSSFQQAQTLTWGDRSNRVNATVYSSVTVSNQPMTTLAVCVSATAWLEDYQRKAQAGVTVALPEREESSDKPDADRGPNGPGP